ncbi:MAG: electron transport complex protein RnfC [Desulfotalea sp.]|nr:MAG: electron transport complex protein RnfC [Desulfotalea sp.]
MSKHILDKIKECGVVGAGGAGLPTHVKAGATVDTVLVNGASCEPLLMSDPYLLETAIDTVILGLNALLDCTGAQKGIICLKGKHKKAMASVLAAVAKDKTGRLQAFELEDFYPAGDEQVMVQEVLGRTVPERGIPLQVGAVVSNVETMYNIALAMEDTPLTQRFLTITGEIKNPMVLQAPVGMSVADIIDFAGGPTIADYRVVDGGPMMGRVLPDIYQPITKTTSGLILLPPEHTVVAGKVMDPAKIRRITNTICCQCTRCTDLCPRNLLGHSLHPHKLMRVLESQVLDSEIAREALLCSECGICEKFACPMMISPREVNAQIKKQLMKAGITWKTPDTPPEIQPYRKSRAIPTSRLIQRLNLCDYEAHAEYAGAATTSKVTIPLGQHIGSPAICTVSVGDRVSLGDLIGEIPPGAMGARIHASIDGTIEAIGDGKVTIRA